MGDIGEVPEPRDSTESQSGGMDLLKSGKSPRGLLGGGWRIPVRQAESANLRPGRTKRGLSATSNPPPSIGCDRAPAETSGRCATSDAPRKRRQPRRASRNCQRIYGSRDSPGVIHLLIQAFTRTLPRPARSRSPATGSAQSDPVAGDLAGGSASTCGRCRISVRRRGAAVSAGCAGWRRTSRNACSPTDSTGVRAGCRISPSRSGASSCG